ncbi:hypothetical protein [Reichenbachiella agariperforans]|uniref:hypothetical protein n=1 Tax=Reichenbachiella agariperforans TaxID=156994 RepID=UPI001C09AC18|nr:hypothetical protein [Reichenbachiella agariperforans]MBU2915206.1 hypothetical protein [Reichenbachiella agariperforans]
MKRVLSRFFSIQRVHVLSDSHGVVYESMQSSFFYQLKTKIVHGATITGIQNINSKTQAKKKFYEYIDKEISVNDFIIFQLGEVDCGFTVWFKNKRDGKSFDKLLDRMLENYHALIEEAYSKQLNKKRLLITSTTLPTISDNQDWGEVAHKRKGINANQYERTQLTLKFNSKLRDLCSLHGYTYIDFDKYLLNPTTGIVHDYYKHENKLDHHLDPRKISQVITKELSSLGLKNIELKKNG